MGSTLTIARQSAVWIVLVVCIMFLCPVEARVWVILTGAISLVYFIVISIVRHRKIRQLALEIDEVLHDGRRVGFSSSREGDISMLSNELGKMVARLARTQEQLREERNALADSLADISHQIRTPLTAITLMLPSLANEDDPSSRKRQVRKLENMIERVSWLVTTLLKMAKIDAGALRVERKNCSCSQVVHRAISPLEAAMDIRGIELKVNVEEGAAFAGDALWTSEALENVVKNCMEHTPADGVISITASENAVSTVIEVEDTGCGIDENDLAHIFERFYRGKNHDAQDAGETSGFGIGLSLAQSLVSAQGGTIQVANKHVKKSGASFTITFPKMIV